MERILAINVSRIGDTLLTTPALRALGQREGVVLDVLAHPKRREVLEGLPFIHRLGSITPTRAKWWLALRCLLGKKPDYDLAVVWGQDEPLVRYALARARRVVAYCQTDEGLNRRLAPAVPLPDRTLHAVRQRLALVTPLQLPLQGEWLSYQVQPEEKAWARALLAEKGPCQPWVGLQLKSFHTKSHRDWPLAHFHQLVTRLLQAYPQAGVLILGGPESRAEAAEMAAHFPGKVLPLSGRLSLRQAGAVMSCLDLYVGVDTGPSHLAGALGIPMVVLYHCAYPASVYGPLERPQAQTIDHPALARGDQAVTHSMADIGVDQVWQAVTRGLARAAARNAENPS